MSSAGRRAPPPAAHASPPAPARRAPAGQPHADGVGHRAADAGVDLVEHQRRRRAAIGQHHLERQQEARQFAAGRDLHQRPRPRAGIGLHPELDAVDAVRPGGGRVAVDLGRELRALELERLEFAIDRLVERGGGLGARFRQRIGRRRGNRPRPHARPSPAP